MTAGERLEIVCDSEGDTVALAAEVAGYAAPGDLILLEGGLGAGKTAFARAFIRAASGDAALEVPSPTFTIVQTYETARLEIAHLDLYRIADASELDELGLEDMRAGVVLVEWPERAPELKAENMLRVALMASPDKPEAREITLEGAGSWAGRVARIGEIREFLDRSGFGDRKRSHMQGDASTRRYERLSGAAILMDSPRRADPGRAGAAAYSRIAHLAEDVTPFVAIARALRERGFSAPQIHAADLERGFLVLEDLGTEGVIDAERRPIPERYETAMDVLAALHAKDLPGTAGSGEAVHELPRYDLGAFLAEVSLLTEWYLPHATGRRLPQEAEEAYLSIWRDLLTPLTAPGRRSTWALRDYHSPNLIWLPERSGIARIGIIDFQDALLGPAAYDVASLSTDARVDVAPELGRALEARYLAARVAAGAGFDREEFLHELALMTAQRNSKILGIFTRLAVRDGKPGYLPHLERIQRYLEAAFEHPALAPLKDWHDEHLPVGERP